MPYDQALDVSSFKESKEFGETRITVGVFAITREQRNFRFPVKIKIRMKSGVLRNWDG